MYDPVPEEKIEDPEKIISRFEELDLRILYCISKGLIQKDMIEVLCNSHSNIKKRMGFIYDNSVIKFRTLGHVVGWMADSKIYFRIVELAEKSGLDKKVALYKQSIPCICFAFLNFSDGLMELIPL